MKSEVIEKILSVEDEALKIRERGEEEAHRIVLEAQSQAASLVKNALSEERARGDEAVAASSAVLDEKLRRLAEQTEKLDSAPSEVDPAIVEKAASLIVDLVCKTDFEEA